MGKTKVRKQKKTLCQRHCIVALWYQSVAGNWSSCQRGVWSGALGEQSDVVMQGVSKEQLHKKKKKKKRKEKLLGGGEAGVRWGGVVVFRGGGLPTSLLGGFRCAVEYQKLVLSMGKF